MGLGVSYERGTPLVVVLLLFWTTFDRERNQYSRILDILTCMDLSDSAAKSRFWTCTFKDWRIHSRAERPHGIPPSKVDRA